MATSLSTLETFMSGMLAGKPWDYDPVCAPIPWRSALAEKPSRLLKIGYYTDDGYVRVQPPNEVAVRRTVTALKSAGHEGETEKGAAFSPISSDC